jgi:hypothetical protein
MRTLIACLAASAVILAGCVTMPEEVPDTYLAEKTADEGKVLDKLKTAIIAKNQEVRILKDKVKDADLKLKIEKGRASILQQEKGLLESKQKQYQLENDAAKMNENAKLMVDNDFQLRAGNDRVDYAKAALELAKAQQEVGEAELAVQVAELSSEKARIAKTYLLKKQSSGVTDDKKASGTGPETYDEKYVKFLEKQRETLVSKKAARDEAALKLKVAEDKIKNRDATK